MYTRVVLLTGICKCINVAYTERKNKDGTVKKEFHESSVHDIVLKTSVLRAYQEFKVRTPFFESMA
jgi:hypothetical protein